jgi:hypothetical protein
LFDYYQPAFELFHAHADVISLSKDPHPQRASYWKLVPPGPYNGSAAIELLRAYAGTVERELETTLSENSIAYYLHLYRRLAPEPIVPEDAPATTMNVRATLEAAVQKYARAGLCSRVGDSSVVGAGKILNGILLTMGAPKEYISSLARTPQLVLTDFGPRQLKDFYVLEKLAYEMWRTYALLRSVSKGAYLIVTEDRDLVGDARSDTLDELIRSFDERHRGMSTSAAGAFFGSSLKKGSGFVLMPVYNVNHNRWGDFERIIEHYMKARILNASIERPNFVWLPFDIRSFYAVHGAFESEFLLVHGCTIESVLLVITSLLVRAEYMWSHDNALPRHWLRAYDGPNSRDLWLSEIEIFLPAAVRVLDAGPTPTRGVLEAVFDFLSFAQAARDRLDVGLGGPHGVFLPCGDKYYADYAWLLRRLYRLFHGLSRTDQNFKGDVLERAVRSRPCVLPTTACRAHDGTSKQVDASFDLGDTLVIVECKAKGWSLGVERGDLAAVAERNRHIIEILRQVDEKARWLAARPIGRNYDLRKFRYILPIGVSPFVEFIPHKTPYWWLTDSLPRVMTPDELERAIQDGVLLKSAQNSLLSMPISTAPNGQ